MFRTKIINLTGAPTKYFMTLGTNMQPIMFNQKSQIMIYKDRERAVREAHERFGKNIILMTIGMGEEKFELFKKDHPYGFVIIE